MRRKIIPVLLGLGGLAAGLGAGLVLRPSGGEAAQPPGAEGAKDHADAAHGDAAHPEAPAKPAGGGHDESATHGSPDAPLEYVKLNNQFVVPVVENGQVAALVVLALSLEVTQGKSERIYEMEPKLRDAALQVLFDHANSGGFSGAFTESAALEPLRQALRETAIRVLGPDVKDVLIVDVMRQDN